MVYYELLEDGTIGRYTNNIKIAQINNYYDEKRVTNLEEDIICAYNGKKYLKGSEPQKPQELIDKENALLRIKELKENLEKEDFKTIKYIQGKLSQEEFDLVVSQCEE